MVRDRKFSSNCLPPIYANSPQNFVLVLALVGISWASPLVKRDAPYPAALPHSTYGEPLAPVIPFVAPAPAPLIVKIETPAADYGPPKVEIPSPIITAPEIFSAPYPAAEEPAEEYGPPPVEFVAPPAPALPELPKLPEHVIPHFPEVKIEEPHNEYGPPAPIVPAPEIFSAPYPAAEEPALEYGPPPAEEYGPPPVAIIAPPAPALPELPKLPEQVIKIDFPNSEYGPPPAVVKIEEPSLEYGPPPATYFAPPPPAPILPPLPLPIIPDVRVPFISAPYPAPIPHEEYGPPALVPTGPYPAPGPVSHYGEPLHKSPFFIR